MYTRFNHSHLAMALQQQQNATLFKWYIVRTLPNQECRLRDILIEQIKVCKNLLEVYCPTHTTVKLQHKGRQIETPLFAGYVFVLATQKVLAELLQKHYPEGKILCLRRGERVGTDYDIYRTVPEAQMQFFKDFNENFAEHVVVLEHPYSTYAFNAKSDEPNEIVKVLDGPLAGRVGYMVRVNRNRHLVFRMRSIESDDYLTVAIPNIWNFHVVRLRNTDGDRLTLTNKKDRAADLLVGLIETTGYGQELYALFLLMMNELLTKSSIVHLCNVLYQKGYKLLSQQLAQLTPTQADDLMYLVRYVKQNADYLTQWHPSALRPFLTPTASVGQMAKAMLVEHESFVESIQPIHFNETTYTPQYDEERVEHVCYFAHVGVQRGDEYEGKCRVFVNFTDFLTYYFRTARGAQRQLLTGNPIPADLQHLVPMAGEERKTLESFAQYAPTLYSVLSGATRIRPVENFLTYEYTTQQVVVHPETGEEQSVTQHHQVPLHVLCIELEASMQGATNEALVEHPDVQVAISELTSVALRICQELASTTHLALWRRLLRTLWLHR